jgi:chemotaxis protein methyltransferase CheR
VNQSAKKRNHDIESEFFIDNSKEISSVRGDFRTAVAEVCSIVSRLSGIQLGEKQNSMVENRLKSRMIRLGIETPDEYLKYLKKNSEAESQILLSLITTHHTYFFREFSHFEFLQLKGLLKIVNAVRARGDKKIRIWSAACSRGQEVYSLAMFLRFYLPQFAPDLDFEILGSDVDPESISFAKNGVYNFKEIKEIPMNYLGNHWARGTGEIADFVKAKNTIRENVNFEVVNLHRFSPIVMQKKFDIIFCRNVFIYFSQDQIVSISKNFLERLHPEGYLFIGISESLTNLSLPIEYCGPSVYRRAKDATAPKQAPALGLVKGSFPGDKPAFVKPQPAAPSYVTADTQFDNFSEKILKVLCVDDSSTILALLKKILVKEMGFEVVGTATNGQEASDFLKKNKVDVVTLDIHMPGMDGIEYLKRNFNSQHVPVVMISTVNRENADLALKSLELGAMDYVEKPTLSNLTEKGDEVRCKLKSAFYTKLQTAQFSQANLSIDKSFKKKMVINQPEEKLRVLVSGMGQRKHLSQLINIIPHNDPPTIIFCQGLNDALETFASSLFINSNGKTFEVLKDLNVINSPTLKVGKFYFVEDKNLWSHLSKSNRKMSVFVMGLPSNGVVEGVLQLKDIQLVLEDLGPNAKKSVGSLQDIASDLVPATSYASVSEEYLA